MRKPFLVDLRLTDWFGNSLTSPGNSYARSNPFGPRLTRVDRSRIVASLPLKEKFSAELPFFIYERGGRVPMAVVVRDRSTIVSPTLGKREAWTVSVAVPGAPATLWVDVKTHAVLRIRYDIAARGLSFTDDRVTALRG